MLSIRPKYHGIKITYYYSQRFLIIKRINEATPRQGSFKYLFFFYSTPFTPTGIATVGTEGE